MRIEKRLIHGIPRDVEIEEYPGEHEDREKDRINMAHADRICEGLARDKEFIKSLAHVIVEQLIEYKDREK